LDYKTILDFDRENEDVCLAASLINPKCLELIKNNNIRELCCEIIQKLIVC